jgi:hypothetical protein
MNVVRNPAPRLYASASTMPNATIIPARIRPLGISAAHYRRDYCSELGAQLSAGENAGVLLGHSRWLTLGAEEAAEPTTELSRVLPGSDRQRDPDARSPGSRCGCGGSAYGSASFYLVSHSEFLSGRRSAHPICLRAIL